MVESTVQRLEMLAKEAADLDVEGLSCAVIFIEDGDEFGQGDYVPEMHLVVRRVNGD
jgi:hypothetical protein